MTLFTQNLIHICLLAASLGTTNLSKVEGFSMITLFMVAFGLVDQTEKRLRFIERTQNLLINLFMGVLEKMKSRALIIASLIAIFATSIALHAITAEASIVTFILAIEGLGYIAIVFVAISETINFIVLVKKTEETQRLIRHILFWIFLLTCASFKMPLPVAAIILGLNSLSWEIMARKKAKTKSPLPRPLLEAEEIMRDKKF